MKTIPISLLLTISFSLGGCAGTTRVLTDTVGAGIGAVVGNKLSHGDPLLTAAGAGAGVLLGETINYGNDHHALGQLQNLGNDAETLLLTNSAVINETGDRR